MPTARTRKPYHHVGQPNIFVPPETDPPRVTKTKRQESSSRIVFRNWLVGHSKKPLHLEQNHGFWQALQANPLIVR